MKNGANVRLGLAGLVVGVTVAAGAGLLYAQGADTVATPFPLRNTAVVGGTLVVTRLTDTSFVVVKDQGDQQNVTLFTTEGGILKKQHAGKFLY